MKKGDAKVKTIGVHVFRKDLRTYDNSALYKCANECDEVLGVFIMDPKQTTSKETSYFRSYNALRFMLESISDLSRQVSGKLWVCTWSTLMSFILDTNANDSSTKKVTTISFNADYTKHALKRDLIITHFADENGIRYISEMDHMLSANMVTKKDGMPYIVFSFYYNEAKSRKPSLLPKRKFTWASVPKDYEVVNVTKLWEHVDKIACRMPLVVGGRRHGLSMLTKSKTSKFDPEMISTKGGTMLSPYINFGCLSVREVYASWNRKTNLKRSLYWRDFYATILATSKVAREYTWLDPRYRKLKWRKESEFLEEWEAMWESKTGFHLIDAATRQLRETGYLPNRARILWSWFCIRILQVDPFDKRYGAMSLFSRNLVDVSTSQNKFNFEWMISSLDLAGRRFARGPRLAGRYVDISNKAITKYKARDWIREWLTEEELALEPIIDIDVRYAEWCKRIEEITGDYTVESAQLSQEPPSLLQPSASQSSLSSALSASQSSIASAFSATSLRSKS